VKIQVKVKIVAESIATKAMARSKNGWTEKTSGNTHDQLIYPRRGNTLPTG